MIFPRAKRPLQLAERVIDGQLSRKPLPWWKSRSSSADLPGWRERRRARPEAETLDSRVLMASGKPADLDPVTSPDLSDRVAQALKPYLDQGKIPAFPWQSSRAGTLRWRKDTGLATW